MPETYPETTEPAPTRSGRRCPVTETPPDVPSPPGDCHSCLAPEDPDRWTTSRRCSRRWAGRGPVTARPLARRHQHGARRRRRSRRAPGQAPRRRSWRGGRLVDLQGGQPGARAGRPGSGARAGHRPAARRGDGHRRRPAPADARGVPAPDRRPPHPRRDGPERRARQGVELAARSRWDPRRVARRSLTRSREGADPAARPCRSPSDVHVRWRPRSAAGRSAASHSFGHGHAARDRPHRPVPRAGAGRLAVHGPSRRPPAPRPDLVLVGRRGAPRLLEAGRRRRCATCAPTRR